MDLRFIRRFFFLYLAGFLLIAPGWYVFSRDATFERFVEIEGFLVVIILVMGGWLLYVATKRSRREARARIVGTQDDRGFFLVLRSFRQTDYYETSGGSLDMEGRLPVAPESILPELGEALSTAGMPALIGDPKLDDSDDLWPGIIVRVKDKFWHDAFKLLSATCRAILVVPGSSPGSLEEIELIRAGGLWQKTIVMVMPPVYSPFISRFDGWDDPHAERTAFDAFRNTDQKVLRQKQSAWNDLRKQIAPKGIHLPEYAASGFLYLPNEDFSARTVATLSFASDKDSGKLTVAQIREALDELLSKEAFPGTPLRRVLNSVAMLEALTDEDG